MTAPCFCISFRDKKSRAKAEASDRNPGVGGSEAATGSRPVSRLGRIPGTI